MSEVLAKPLRYQEIAMEDMRQMIARPRCLRRDGAGMVDMLTAKNEGMDQMVAQPVPNNAPPGFRHWCEAVLKPVLQAT